MLSIQLPREYERKLEVLCQNEQIPLSEIIQHALDHYFSDYEETKTPYELGQDLFGRYGSSKGDLSTDYKTMLKAELHEKHAH